nr:putative lipid-binding protein At4g00165 [Oryza sativa Japonica Group]
MAQTGSSITAHAALVAVVAVAVLCLTGAKPSAACKLGKSNCLPPICAAVCLCLAIKASVLGDGVKLEDVAVDLPLLVNYCGRNVPEGFKCA